MCLDGRAFPTGQMQHYVYAEMRRFITNTHLFRPEFTTMPGVMRPLWDLYWSAMDMTESLPARRAVAKTCKLFSDYPNRSPGKDRVLDAIDAYAGLTRLKDMVRAAMRLADEEQWRVRIQYHQGGELYDGSWFQRQT